MNQSRLFEAAAEQWDLARLYADMAVAKAEVAPHKRPELTGVEQARLRGLLLGYSPAAIAEQQYATVRTVEVALSQGLYRYVEVLTGRDRNILEGWRDVASWLQLAGYQYTPVAVNWAQMPEVPVFYGREVERDQLKGWLLQEPACRMVTINGPAGIGKTSLAIHVAKAVQGHFDGMIWQSLRHKPPLDHMLGRWLAQISCEPLAPSEWYDQLSWVMDYFREHRCLVVIDNLEVLFSHGSLIANYEPGYEAYGEFFRRLREETHKSSVIVTSREQHRELRGAMAMALPVRQLSLSGLEYPAAEQILRDESLLAPAHWRPLVQQYRGNPLMLRIVAMTIQEVFDGDVRGFLKQRMTLFGDIRYLIDQQYDRLSDEEQAVLYQLAERAEPVQLACLSHPHSLEAIASLLRRSLIEKSAAGFLLRPIMLEYVQQHVHPPDS